MPSIRQSVQNGQFLCRLAQNASDLLVASHADKGIERLLMRVVATAHTAKSMIAPRRLMHHMIYRLNVVLPLMTRTGSSHLMASASSLTVLPSVVLMRP